MRASCSNGGVGDMAILDERMEMGWTEVVWRNRGCGVSVMVDLFIKLEAERSRYEKWGTKWDAHLWSQKESKAEVGLHGWLGLKVYALNLLPVSKWAFLVERETFSIKETPLAINPELEAIMETTLAGGDAEMGKLRERDNHTPVVASHAAYSDGRTGVKDNGRMNRHGLSLELVEAANQPLSKQALVQPTIQAFLNHIEKVRINKGDSLQNDGEAFSRNGDSIESEVREEGYDSEEIIEETLEERILDIAIEAPFSENG
ncbi:hypothetical protein Syun_000712 [Stephania yunnanensis]|uniref:Uncharacterized protein n=1 Tax=Stephania yunnanensis TaxID=152371 RepID=A0AAP0LE67_9MAGN